MTFDMFCNLLHNSRMAEHHRKNNIRQHSRKPKASGTLASQIRVIEEFVNLRDDDAERFRAKHPDFVLSANLTEKGWLEGVVHRLGGGGPLLVSGRALLIAENIRKLQPS